MRQLRECVNALSQSGLTVYMPALHEGVCTAPYCVVQYMGSTPESSIGTGYDVLRVHIYAPVGRFALVDELLKKAEKAMEPLVKSGAVRPCEGIGACTVDDTYKAYACHLDYRVQYGLNA